jgi:hypothetical protein
LGQVKPVSGSSSVAALDSIIDEAPDLRTLLATPALVDRYYAALYAYFGRDRFNRRAFDAILAQLRKLVVAVPELEKRLWSSESRGVDFLIPTVGRTSGRDIDLALWRLYRFQWLARLRIMAGLSTYDENRATLLEDAKPFLEEAAAQVRNFEIELTKGLKRKEQRDLRSKFFRKLKGDPRFSRVSALYLYLHLTSDQNRHFFQHTDPDLILEYLDRLRANTKQIAAARGVAPVLAGKMRELIPSRPELLTDLEMFPLRYRQRLDGRKIAEGSNASTVYATRFIRPLHSIWLGIPHADCLGGDPAFLDHLTAERWAVGLLKDAETFVFERDTAYAGFGRIVPLLGPDEAVFESLELWAPLLGTPVLYQEKEDWPFSVMLFDLWFPRFFESTNHVGRKIVVSDSNFIDNAGIKKVIFASPHLNRHPKSHDSKCLRHLDPLVARIRAFSPRTELFERYHGDMILDATVSDAKRIHEIAPLQVPIKHYAEVRRDLEELSPDFDPLPKAK